MCDSEKVISPNGTEYIMKEPFSKGGYGTLYLLDYFAPDESQTRKHKLCIKKADISATGVKEMFETEIDILRACKHKYILEIFDGFTKIENGYQYGYIVSKYYPETDLFNLLVNEGNEKLLENNEYKAKHLMHNVLSALDHMHSIGYCHRDIKLENILIEKHDSEIHGILADFGYATPIDEHAYYTEGFGSEGFYAPEIKTNGLYNYKCDYWSFGVVLFVTLYGFMPYDPRLYISSILNCSVDYDNENVSIEANDLIQKFLQIDPDERITFKDALNHPWFAGIESEVAVPLSKLPDSPEMEEEGLFQ